MSVTSPSSLFFENATTSSRASITSSPSQNTSQPFLNNTACSSCAFAVDERGLQQIFWLSETLSITLDTEYVTVTSFNGSIATATNSTRTLLGDVNTLTQYLSIYDLIDSVIANPIGYYNDTPTFARGTDGNVGTTSFPYGQAFIQVTAINYHFVAFKPDTQCPANMGLDTIEADLGCQCMLNTFFPFRFPPWGVNDSLYIMDRTYYQPLASTLLNESNAAGVDDQATMEGWDGKAFESWIAEDEAFKSAFPNWRDCAFWDQGKSILAAKRHWLRSSTLILV